MRADFKISYIDEDRDCTTVKTTFYYGDFEMIENPVTNELENTYVRYGVIDIKKEIFIAGTTYDTIESSLKTQLADYCSNNDYEAIDEQK